MAITLNKTLQGTQYTLYITTQIGLHYNEQQQSINIIQNFYQSKGHFDDDFLPIIRKEIVIENEQRVNSIKLLLRENYNEALSIAENFLVNNTAYYQGGVVTNGTV